MCISAIGCNGKKTTDTTITVSESWEFVSFYPVASPENSTNFGSAYWSRNFYDTLVEYDDNGMIQGALAESWTVSDDGKTYTFKLRSGIKFSDGTPLTANDVKATFDAAHINLGAYLGSYGKVGALITSTEAKDDLTFVITLSNPYYAALNDLTFCNVYGTLPARVFENGATAAFDYLSDMTIGTGPYMLDKIENGVYMFVANPYYWREKPDVTAFNIKVISDNNSKALALQSGEIDIVIGSDRLTSDSFIQLKNSGYGTAIGKYPGNSLYLGMRISPIYIWNDTYTEVVSTIEPGVFADKNVRQAAAYAVDQQLIASTIFNGIDEAAETLFPKTMANCDVDQVVYNTDVAKAKQLLADAGWADTNGDGVLEKDGKDLSIKLTYSNYVGDMTSAMAAVKSQLESVGFSVTLNDAADMLGWFYAALGGDYDLIIWKSNGGAYDPSSTIGNIASAADPIMNLMIGHGDISYELMAELDTAASSERVAEIYETILTTISGDSLLLPLVYSKQISAWNADKIKSYTHPYDSSFVMIQNIELK